MALRDRVARALPSLASFFDVFSAPSPAPVAAPSVTPKPPVSTPYRLAAARRRKGRIHVSPRRVRTRWYPGDEENALYLAEQGNLQRACQLIDAMRSDGVIRSLLEIRSNGLIKLPVHFDGDPDLCQELEGKPDENDDGLFWKIAPSNEQARIIRWGIQLGMGIGEIVDTEDDGLGDGVLYCLDPHHVRVVTSGPDQGRMFYQTDDGEEEIIFGNGRWFGFFPYGKKRFWLEGTWLAAAEAWLSKKDSRLQRNAWGRRLAAGIVHWKAPHASSDRQRDRMRDLFASLTEPPIAVTKKDSKGEGWDLDYQESSGQGYQVWKQERGEANEELAIIFTGSPINVWGTAGFASGDIQATVSHTFVEGNGKTWGEAITTDLLSPLAERRGAFSTRASWQTARASDKKTEGEALTTFGGGVKATNEALAPYGQRLKIAGSTSQFGIETEPLAHVSTSTTVSTVAPAQLSAAFNGLDTDENDDAPDLEHRTKLAEMMTACKLQQCEHGRPNKCPLCGVERDRGVTLGPDGSPQWQIAWRPIARSMRALPSGYKGVPVRIEYPAGSTRTGPGWTTKMSAHYGDIPGTVGNDSEPLDVYLSPKPTGDVVFILAQLKPDGNLDEYKIFLGFPSWDSVVECYLVHVPRPELLGDITPMPIDVLAGLCGDGPIARVLSEVVATHRALYLEKRT